MCVEDPFSQIRSHIYPDNTQTQSAGALHRHYLLALKMHFISRYIIGLMQSPKYSNRTIKHTRHADVQLNQEFINLHSHAASITLLIPSNVHNPTHTLCLYVLAVHINASCAFMCFRKKGDIPCKSSPVVKKGKAKNTQVTDFGVLS